MTIGTSEPSLPIAEQQAGNITLLQNGDAIFPAMLEAIYGARYTICFETFIYWKGKIAEEVAEALSERARAGVAVHVLLDWVGTFRMDEALIDLMLSAGVEVEKFRPLRWFNLRRVNYRTHRKLLIVDGRIGFTGGVGVADEWQGHAQDPEHWRDNHYRLTGAAVGELQRAFFSNWVKVHGWKPEPGSDVYYPELEPTPCLKVISGSPWSNRDQLQRMFLEAIDSANESIRIATAYFMPGEKLFRALIRARKRGVHIEILMCGVHTDRDIVRQASRAHWGRLLKAGVRLFEYEPTLYHVKLLVVDSEWISIGSANFDARSCWLNDELNVNVHEKAVVREHITMFQEDLAKGRKLSLVQWEQRPVLTKIGDWISQLFRRQL
ncbi:MAG: phospholipase D-like domain-containing protein [Verrucomicrobiales bacterium]